MKICKIRRCSWKPYWYDETENIAGIRCVCIGPELGLQVGSVELANTELEDDLVDMAAQLGQQSGLDSPRSDEELRGTVIRKAGKYGIHLKPEQVTVRQDHEARLVHPAADYDVRIVLPAFSLTWHFTPSRSKK
jgi:hypothetical protein